MSNLSKLKSHGLFDARAPRFTSYPPANRFVNSIGPDQAAAWLGAAPPGAAVSLYLHVPFCRRLCWFCACRTQGTKTDRPLGPYVDRLIAEMAMIREALPRDIRVRRLHLGGGTPTILPVAEMGRLLAAVDRHFGLSALDEFSVEIDPTEIDAERLALLAEAGLSRASLGVQDFDETVQRSIGRLQSPEATRAVAEMLAGHGITALNIDLVYGLPHQTAERLERTLDHVLALRPTRLALYGYAHVPWAAKRQRVIPADALPGPEARFDLAAHAAERLIAAGMRPIGIDHFALPSDALAKALEARRLARNFQGYTDDRAPYLIGLGASAISRLPEGYLQNHSATADYQRRIAAGQSAAARGYALSPWDQAVAEVIEQLMCYFEWRPTGPSGPSPAQRRILARLLERFPDAVTPIGTGAAIQPWARPLVRIIAAALSDDAAPASAYSVAV